MLILLLVQRAVKGESEKMICRYCNWAGWSPHLLTFCKSLFARELSFLYIPPLNLVSLLRKRSAVAVVALRDTWRPTLLTQRR
jgi:hypothetical protein